MARRRDAAAEAAMDAGAPPEHLLRWDGRYVDHDEPVPNWWERPSDVYRNLGGWSRWMAARRAWCAERGLDYWPTFYGREVVDRTAEGAEHGAAS